MNTKTQKLMLQGGLILLGALVVSSFGGWARRASADDQPVPASAPVVLGELRGLQQALEATRGELAVARLQLERANAIIEFSTHYTIAADLSAAIYDVALAEGTVRQLYDRNTNLRIGFRYLRDLLERYEGSPEAKLRLALLAYNRGPGRVQELLDAGRDPQNGYATVIMKGYRRKS